MAACGTLLCKIVRHAMAVIGSVGIGHTIVLNRTAEYGHGQGIDRP